MAKIQVTINGKEFVSAEAKKAGESLSGMKTAGEAATKALETGAKVAAAAFAGITTAIGAVTAAAVKSADLTDRVDKLSQKIGMSREAFQEWEFIMSQNGMEIDKLQTSMKTLSDAADEASRGSETYSRTFEALGVSLYDVNGIMKDQETLFNETIVALTGIENTTTRAALASDLLGRSSTELAPLLNSGTGAIEEMRAKAHDLGLILSDETVDAGVRFTDTMDQVKRSVSAVATNALTPFMDDLDNLGQAFLGVVKGESGSANEMADALSSTIETALDAVVNMIPQVVEIGSQVIMSLIQGITQDLPMIASTAIDIVLSLVDTIITNLPMLITAAIDIIITLAEAIVDAVPQLVEKVPEIVEALAIGIIENAPKLIMSGIELMLELAAGLIKAIPTIITYLPQIVTSMVNGFKESVPKFLEMGKDIIAGLLQGIKDFANKPVEAVKDVGRKVVDGFKDFFGIRSPSKLFASFGGYFMEGLAEGIEQNEGIVAQALLNAGITPDMGTSVGVNVTTTSNNSGSGSSSSNGSAITESPIMKMIEQFAGGLGGMVSSLSSVQAILDPISTILGGMMEVLGPVIDSVLSPLVGILKILGQTIGKILTPVIQWLSPIIGYLGEVFIWLYNKILVPVGNGFITVFNAIGIGIATIVNGIISAINWALGWAGVNLNKVNVPGLDDGKLTAISTGDLTAAGSSYIGGGSGSGVSGSSTSVQSYNIEVHQVVQGNVIGDGGMTELGRFFVEAVEAYLGSGGRVSFVRG